MLKISMNTNEAIARRQFLKETALLGAAASVAPLDAVLKIPNSIRAPAQAATILRAGSDAKAAAAIEQDNPIRRNVAK